MLDNEVPCTLCGHVEDDHVQIKSFNVWMCRICLVGSKDKWNSDQNIIHEYSPDNLGYLESKHNEEKK